jgi:hypothetical protein
MKRGEPSSQATLPSVLDTFGGGYHRLESDFRPKRETAPAGKLLEEKNTKQAKARRKKPAL